MWTLGKHVLQIQVEVFHAVAATEEHGEYGPYKKYSTKGGDLLRFLLYLCHVIDDFACLVLQH